MFIKNMSIAKSHEPRNIPESLLILQNRANTAIWSEGAKIANVVVIDADVGSAIFYVLLP